MLDFGGGSGLLVRLLRDVGIESYWSDEYCENLFARGFEWQENIKPTLATCFEVFEHLPNPREQIDSMLKICPNLLFSTELLPCPIPESNGANAWWYYGFSHGQHISFYTYKSLELIAKAHNLHFCSYGGLHLFSQVYISPLHFKWLIRLAHRGLFTLIKRRFYSKTMSDCEKLSQAKL
ncbi:class I SAM-dependent methyltransferase [Helicobacter cinaedi]|uniref:class I SAM-dependent methyltransferase n=1 Tax=Helicobacter cinaedi TaxID=213 RepID=UPI000CF0CD3F|nr:class I SAM-dependent methyltransferase [Helicobacter cinaedi]